MEVQILPLGRSLRWVLHGLNHPTILSPAACLPQVHLSPLPNLSPQQVFPDTCSLTFISAKVIFANINSYLMGELASIVYRGEGGFTHGWWSPEHSVLLGCRFFPLVCFLDLVSHWKFYLTLVLTLVSSAYSLTRPWPLIFLLMYFHPSLDTLLQCSDVTLFCFISFPQ